MSQENVELVRRWLDAMRATPAEVLVPRLYDPDADYYPVRKFPEARPCHGHDEIVQFVVGYVAAWSHFEYAIRDLIGASGFGSTKPNPALQSHPI